VFISESGGEGVLDRHCARLQHSCRVLAAEVDQRPAPVGGVRGCLDQVVFPQLGYALRDVTLRQAGAGDDLVHRATRAAGNSCVTAPVSPVVPGQAYHSHMNVTVRTRAGLVAGAVAGIAVLASACGGGGSPSSVAHLGKPGTATTAPLAASSGESNLQQIYQETPAFAECMRSHGVPSYSDPQLVNTPTARGIRMGGGGDPNSPQFKAANNDCKHLLPNGGNGPTQAQMQAAMAHALKFAQCMRQHGVPNFPDPTESANGRDISIGGNVEANSPQVQTAQKACQSDLPGF
jgi:hypothetical protein